MKMHNFHCVYSITQNRAITTKKSIQGKLNDRGTVALFVGYPENHAENAYRGTGYST
jgi:hypothetical protein